MEPFGLFQFLQSLLNTQQFPQENAPSPSCKNAEESAPSPISTPSESPKGNDTYAQFISAHDSRIKKTRK